MNRECFISTSSINVIEALKKIDIGGRGILFIVDHNRCLLGCITDGDIRRWIIKSNDLNAKVSIFMNRSPKYLFKSDIHKASEYMKKYPISAIPILNEDKEIEDIIFQKYDQDEPSKEIEGILKDTSVVVMAGGKGTRLYPYTKILPKPLIPIGDIPIIERITNRFVEYGVKEFFFTVNYKKGMIKSYFDDLNPKYDIQYVEENKPLGTAGSLRLILKRFQKPFFVTNCDVLIDADYEDLYRYHVTSKNKITIISALKNISIPYGVLKLKEGGEISSMEEKPSISNFINTGMYVINPELIELIPEDTFYHMPQLAEEAIKQGMKVSAYPISEDAYLDMGEIEEMKRMEQKLKV